MRSPSDASASVPDACGDASGVADKHARSAWQRATRWLSLRAYGAVASALFGAATPPLTLRRRFERL